ncbi:MAG TPA: amidohydrolase family protein, partial [Bacillota bacterium]
MERYDLIVRNARLRTGETVDLGIRDGRFAAVTAGLAGEADRQIDAGGRLVSPPLIEPHCHLDAALSEGQPRSNASGTLLEGIAIWAERKQTLTIEDV